MATTLEIREIMHRGGAGHCSSIYTNKPRGACGNKRIVKCYMPGDHGVAKKLVEDLISAAGPDAVNMTVGGYQYGAGITVRCELA